MKEKCRRVCALLLALLLLAGCAAPGAADAPQKENGKTGDITLPVQAADADTDTGKTASVEAEPEALETRDELAARSLPEGMASVTAQCAVGQMLYLGGVGQDGAVFARMDAAGEVEMQTLPEPFDFFYALCRTEDGFDALCGSYPLTYMDADGNLAQSDPSEGSMTLLHFDADGRFRSETPLAERYGGNGESFKGMVKADGGYVCHGPRTLVFLAEDGTQRGRIDAQQDSGQVFAALAQTETAVYALVCDRYTDAAELWTLDTANADAKAALPLDCGQAGGLGIDADGGLLLNTEEAVLRLDAGSGETQTLFSWESLGVNGQSYAVLEPWAGGYALYEPYQETADAIQKVTAAPRRELTLAAGDVRGLTAIVNDFNRSQTRYTVKIVNYSGEEMDRLRTEVLAGNSPDLFCFETPQTSLTKACADLYPMLDADAELGRGFFVPGLLEAMTEGGALYWLPYSFHVSTMIASADDFDHAGVSFQELETRLAALDGEKTLFQPFVTKSWLLSVLAPFAAARLVDEAEGTCRFDSEEFLELLEFCGRWGAEEKSEEDLVLAYESGAAEPFTAVLEYGIYVGVPPMTSYADHFYFLGYPTQDGTEKGGMFGLELCFAMAAQPSDPEGAWEFLRFVMHRNEQETEGAYGGTCALPASQKAMDAMIEKMQTTGSRFLGTETKVSVYAAAQFRQLIESTTRLESADKALLEIVNAESLPFFYGEKTAEEAARIIQNRASLYLAERSAS